MQSEVKKWGNSAAIRLPNKILAAAHLNTGSSITIEVKERKIIIEEITNPRPKRLKLPFSEKTLLSGLTPNSAHADELASVSGIELGD